jgi:hypothetical protein
MPSRKSEDGLFVVDGKVQQPDISKHGFLTRLSGGLTRIVQTRETWKLRGWGFAASRERVETTTEMGVKHLVDAEPK